MVGVVEGYQLDPRRIVVQFLAGQFHLFCSSHYSSEHIQSPTAPILREQNGSGLKLITHRRLVPSSRMSGFIQNGARKTGPPSRTPTWA